MCIDLIGNSKGASSSNGEQTKETMEETLDAYTDVDDGLRIRRVAGGCMVRYPPLFSSDGNLLFIIYENTIQGFNVTTGELMHNYINTANDSSLIGMAIDSTNSKYIYGCTVDGLIISWKINSGLLCDKMEVLRNGKFQVESFHILYDSNEASSFLIFGRSTKRMFIQYCPRSKKILEVINLRLQSKKDEPYHEKGDERVVAAPGGYGLNYFAFIAVDRWYWCQMKGKVFVDSRQHCSGVKPVIVTCHPFDAIVAVGDTLGRVVLYRNFLQQRSPIPEMYHWHPFPVKTMAFGNSGTHFYSGGSERVLVKWSVGRPDKLDVIPRLPDTVLYVAVGSENLKLAVCTADNGIQILNALHKQTAIVQSFSRITGNASDDEVFPAGLRVNPRTQAIVLNGREGCIQFFSTYTKSLLYTLDITLRNNNVNEENTVIHNTVVTNIAVNAYWLATVESWTDNQYSIENRLKFWKYDESRQTYSLNTNLESVHHGGVSDIAFSSSTRERDLQCATAGRDRRIKVWSLEGIQTTDRGEKLAWICVGSVQHRNLPVKSISFSQDASILAGGFGNVLCSWNSETLQLKCALSAPGGYDGCVNRALVKLPTTKKGKTAQSKQTQESYEENRAKITTEMIALMNGKEKCSRLKMGTNSSNQRKRFLHARKVINDSTTKHMSENYKKLIMNKTVGNVQMNMAHRIDIYRALKIRCRTTEDIRSRMKQKLFTPTKQSARKLSHRLQKLVQNMDTSVRFRGYRKFSNYDRRRLVAAALDKAFEDVFGDQKQKTTSTKKESSAKDSAASGIKATVPIKSFAQIKKVLFCHGQFSHLLVVCTENRLIVWNLLSLKIQVSALLTIDQLALDPFTNLIAAFTVDNEVYVFLPNNPMPLYHRNGMPKVYGAVWIPRRYPRSQSFNVDWQATSQLYFLNEKQELLQLVSDSDEESLGPVVCMNESPIGLNTPFAAMLVKQANGSNVQPYSNGLLNSATTLGSTANSTAKDIISSSSHTMAPISLLCKDFLRSLLVVEERRSKDQRAAASAGKNKPVADGDSGSISDPDAEQDTSDGENNNSARSNGKQAARKAVHTALDKMTKTTKRPDIAIEEDVKLRKLLEEPMDIVFA
uniref:WD repeat-containing protein 75 second beta-propeller domain-containing protein n=1 Tax=Anopheles farauti TaxID=69004 RepID=A0A182QJP8_9DIPT